MDFKDFRIKQQNGQEEQLKSVKHGVRKEMLSPKNQQIFEAYDHNKNGTLENNELGNILNGLSEIAKSYKDDKILDFEENDFAKSVFFKNSFGDVDFMGFVKSISDAGQNIIKVDELTIDGEKEIVTYYSDNSVERIRYYADGEYKYKKLTTETPTGEEFYIIGGAFDKQYNAEEIEKIIKEAYDKEITNRKQESEKAKPLGEPNNFGIVVPAYNVFKADYIKQNSIVSSPKIQTNTQYEFSERGKKDREIREFTMKHYIETHEAAKNALETMGIVDKVGVLLNTGAEKIWNSIKNIWNGTKEEFDDFYDMTKKFEPNYERVQKESNELKKLQNNPELFFSEFKYDFNQAKNFNKTFEKFADVQILKEKTDELNDAIRKMQGLTTRVDMPGDINTFSQDLSNVKNLLMQIFDNDEKAVNLIMNSISVGYNVNTTDAVELLKSVKENFEKILTVTLDGKTFEEIQNEYKEEYKSLYKTNLVPEDLLEKVTTAKMTGGLAKLAVITVVLMLLTKSPAMQNMNLAVAGSTEATGTLANATRALVATFGKTATKQALKFAMATNMLAMDIGGDILNQLTDDRDGINIDELEEQALNSAKYIYTGSFIGGPLAEQVSKFIGKIAPSSSLLEGGIKNVSKNGTQTTTISADKLLQNISKGNSKLIKIAQKGGEFTTELATFTAVDVITEDNNLGDTLSEQGSMLSKIKTMNFILAYFLGAKTHSAISPNITKALECSGIKEWNIKEVKTPEKTHYEVDIYGAKIGEFENLEQVTLALMEKVAQNYKAVETKSKEEISETKPPKQDVKGVNTAENTKSPTNLSNFNNTLAEMGLAGKLHTLEAGRHLIEIETGIGKYDYYEFDANNNLINLVTNLSKSDFANKFADYVNAKTGNCGSTSGTLFAGIPLFDKIPSGCDFEKGKSLREEIEKLIRNIENKEYELPIEKRRKLIELKSKYSSREDLDDLVALAEQFEIESVYKLADLKTKQDIPLLNINNIKILLNATKEQNPQNIIDRFVNVHNKFISSPRKNYVEDKLFEAFMQYPEYVERIIDNQNFNSSDILEILRKANKYPNNIEDIIAIVETKNKDGQYKTADEIDDMFEIPFYCPGIRFYELINSNQNKEGLEISQLKDICKFQIRVNDDNDNGINNLKNDPKRIEKYTRILNNTKIRSWVIKNINAGFSMDEIAAMVQTKQTYHFTSNSQIDPQTQYFMSFGMEEINANKIVTAITNNGVKDPAMEQAAILLINSNYDNSKIAEVLNFAKLNGQFNELIVKDAIAIKDIDLNPLLKKYLPALKNLNGTDITLGLNARAQLKSMLEGLSAETKIHLFERNYNTNDIIKKLEINNIKRPTNSEKNNRPTDFRTKFSLSLYEKLIVEKYKPEERIWRYENTSKQWAEEKYQEMKQLNYKSTRTGERVNLEEVNRQRKEGLNDWFEFMEQDPEISQNPFVKIVITDFITKNLKPNNSNTPPTLNKNFVKEILAQTLNTNNDFSFAKLYNEKLSDMTKNQETKRDVVINGKKMTWYTIPKTSKNDPKFNECIAKIETLSEGTNWCLRTWKAREILDEGNLHFLVDENGMSQVCIREFGTNCIFEIQKRQEDFDIPIPIQYLEYIDEFAHSKDYSITTDVSNHIEKARNNKGIYENKKAELKQFVERKDYKGLLESMGISVKILPDRTWEISHYSPYVENINFGGPKLDRICLNDFDINENDILANVSIIRGDADFRDSNITKLPKLKEVGGKLKAEYSNISNLQNLQKINGRTIIWD